MIKKNISVDNISFSYNKNRKIYDGFSLDINENEIFFLMGTNGCGKTTLLKIMSSLLIIDSGRILIYEKDLYEYDSKSLSKIIAYVPQIIHLNSDFLVKDYLVLGRTPHMGIFDSPTDVDYKVVEKHANDLGITSILDVEFNSLSGGQKQNVAICRALIQETPIIIMDEPMSALDIGKQADFLKLLIKLKSEGKTIILTSHNPNHAFAIEDKCKVCLLDNGRIIGVGACCSVMSRENIKLVYGDKVYVNEENQYIEFCLS